MKKAFKISVSNSIEEIEKIDEKIEKGIISFDNDFYELEHYEVNKQEVIFIIEPEEILVLVKALNQVPEYKYQINEYGIDDVLDKINEDKFIELTDLDKRILENKL